MRSLRSTTLLAVAAWLMGCGGSDGGTTDPNANTNAGGGRTMTATYNGVAFNPTLLTSAYLNAAVSVNAADNSRSFSLSALNITAVGTYSFASANSNSGLVMWHDGQNIYSTGSGGTGTVTFTVLQLGRVAGSFNVVAKNSLTSTAPGMTLVGSFDIKFP